MIWIKEWLILLEELQKQWYNNNSFIYYVKLQFNFYFYY